MAHEWVNSSQVTSPGREHIAFYVLLTPRNDLKSRQYLTKVAAPMDWSLCYDPDPQPLVPAGYEAGLHDIKSG
jgi:hypothetical protein